MKQPIKIILLSVVILANILWAAFAVYYVSILLYVYINPILIPDFLMHDPESVSETGYRVFAGINQFLITNVELVIFSWVAKWANVFLLRVLVRYDKEKAKFVSRVIALSSLVFMLLANYYLLCYYALSYEQHLGA